MKADSTMVILAIFAILAGAIIIYMLIPKIAEPSMEVHGNQQAYVIAKTTASSINALTYADEGEIIKTFDVEWDVDGESAFMVQVCLLAEERKDFLKDIAESLSSMETNILKIDMKTENSLITSYMILEVRDLSHLTKVIRRLHCIKNVISVGRGSEIEKMMDTPS